MTNDPLVRKLLKAARQRLTSAGILLANDQFLDSTYLAGYGVECALKALLITRTPSKSRKVVQQQVFRGKAGHDFENLKARLRKCQVNFPATMAKSLRTVATWSTDLRYELGRGSAEEAEAFYQAAIAILNWAEEQS